MVEALAVVTALEFARDIGFQQIILEGDSVGIINQLSSTCQDLSYIEVVLAKGRAFSNQFVSCLFVHTRRKGNIVAHALAQFEVTQSDVKIWVEESPFFIQDVDNADLNHLNK
ncbi:hypothetical protein PTKIN_Ptkin09bG0161900 [Pterospermum kingtungense]